MAKFVMDDGTEVVLSKETTKAFQGALKQEEKKFWVDSVFKRTDSVNATYRLIVGADFKAYLMFISGRPCGNVGELKSGQGVQIYLDITEKEYYTKKLPTSFPGEFGLDRKYGI